MGVVHAETAPDESTEAGLKAADAATGFGLATKGSTAPRGAALAPGGAPLVAVGPTIMLDPISGA